MAPNVNMEKTYLCAEVEEEFKIKLLIIAN